MRLDKKLEKRMGDAKKALLALFTVVAKNVQGSFAIAELIDIVSEPSPDGLLNATDGVPLSNVTWFPLLTIVG